MKVLFFINRISNQGGSERATVVIANKLASLGYEVHLLTWMGGVDSYYELNKKIKISALFSKDVSIYSAYLYSLYKYHKFIKKLKPDFIIDVCTALSLLTVPLKFINSFKLISWEHFNVGNNWNSITPRLSRWLAARFATNIVTLTERDCLDFKNHFNARNAIVIPNPLTVEVDGVANLNAKTVLSIGRFTHQKGFDLLLKSWVIVRRKHPDWILKIIGNGVLMSDLLKQIEQDNLTSTVQIIEPSLDVASHYKSSSIFVLSSRFEGLPLVLIEAKSFGLPIVSFDCKTGPSDIVNHLKDGVLVEPENTNALASSIIQLMGDSKLRQKYSESALIDKNRFDIDRVIKHWQNILVFK